MDSFGNYPQDRPFDPFSVMLFKALQVDTFLFFIALLVMNPQAKEGKIESKAEFIVTMDWPDNHPDDLDLFVQDAAGNISAASGEARTIAMNEADYARLDPMGRLDRCAFDNVCSCIRRDVWVAHPFRSTPIAEDSRSARPRSGTGDGCWRSPTAWRSR